MSAQPVSTATFLFTDVEGSTQLWERHPDAMQGALARHDALLRHAVEQHHGRIVKTTGDGLHAVFVSAGDAVSAVLVGQQALQAEPWGETGPLRARMALHTGEAEAREGDYYGPALNRAARLAAVGHGGQVILSGVTAALVHDHLPPGAVLRDLGQHRLKDLVQAEHVFQLGHPSLPDEFPPLRSLAAFPHNLPFQMTRLVGREQELAEIRRLLAGERLLTLTGPGGTGKTRLALQVGAELVDHFAHGVWLVELAPLSDPDLVLPAVASALDVREQPGWPLLNALTDYLRYKDLLLVLDNCEHVIEASARLAAHLLSACPKLKVLASSREALGLAGEVAFRVPSLGLPAASQAALEDVARSEAVQLFVERAQAARPGFTLRRDNAASIAQICARLDGIPLALELAAARARALSAEQIALRLNDRFRLLVGGSRAALPRQQTLRALIDWSWDLLSEPERVLLRRLSVFAGGWTLEAAESVGSDQAAVSGQASQPNTARVPLSAEDILDTLTQLVNKSLVLAEHRAGQEPRYRLLETIRQYARDKLLEAGEAETVRDRHLAFFLEITLAAEARLQGPEMVACLDHLELEQDNLRAALEWASEKDLLTALRMVAVLFNFFGRRASTTEGRAWLKAALAQTEGETSRPFLLARARALAGESALAFGQGENAASRDAAGASVALARQLNEPRTLAFALGMAAMASGMLGDRAAALTLGQEGLALCRQNGYDYELGIACSSFGIVAYFAGDLALSRQLQEEGINLARRLGSPWVMAMYVLNAARIAAMTGNPVEARARFEEAAALFGQMRDQNFVNGSRSDLAHFLRRQGQLAEATALYQETLPAWVQSGNRGALAHELECFGFMAISTGQGGRAARLLGAAEALREASRSDMTPLERVEYDQALAQLRAQIDQAALRTAWAEGQQMDLEQAVGHALRAPG